MKFSFIYTVLVGVRVAHILICCRHPNRLGSISNYILIHTTRFVRSFVRSFWVISQAHTYISWKIVHLSPIIPLSSRFCLALLSMKFCWLENKCSLNSFLTGDRVSYFNNFHNKNVFPLNETQPHPMNTLENVDSSFCSSMTQCEKTY